MQLISIKLCKIKIVTKEQNSPRLSVNLAILNYLLKHDLQGIPIVGPISTCIIPPAYHNKKLIAY